MKYSVVDGREDIENEREAEGRRLGSVRWMDARSPVAHLDDDRRRRLIASSSQICGRFSSGNTLVLTRIYTKSAKIRVYGFFFTGRCNSRSA